MPGQVASLHDRLTYDPRHVDNPQRQGRLKGTIGTVTLYGAEFDQWQYEITGGGRVWHVADDDKHTVWITMASPATQKQPIRGRSLPLPTYGSRTRLLSEPPLWAHDLG